MVDSVPAAVHLLLALATVISATSVRHATGESWEPRESLSAAHPLVQWPSLGNHWPAHLASAFPAPYRGALRTALRAYNYSLPLDALQRGLAYKGHTTALHRIFDKLHRREQITVQALGGSITAGHGLNFSQNDQTYIAHTCTWLRQAFPGALVKCINGGAPATQSELLSVCLDKWVKETPDIITVEFSVNDGYTPVSPENDITRAFERLMRKLLSRNEMRGGHPPAMLLIHFLPTGLWSNGKMWHPGIDEQPYVQSSHQFWANAETNYDILAQFYNVPSVSIRNALWERIADPKCPAGFRRADFMGDDLRHPTALGHKYTADVVVWMLQQALLDWAMAGAMQPLSPVHLESGADDDGLRAANAAGRGEGTAEGGTTAAAESSTNGRRMTTAATGWEAGPASASSGAGHGAGAARHGQGHAALPPAPLPPPLFQYNHVDQNMLCAVGKDLPSLRVPSSVLGARPPPPPPRRKFEPPPPPPGAAGGAAGATKAAAGAIPNMMSALGALASAMAMHTGGMGLGTTTAAIEPQPLAPPLGPDDEGWEWTDEGRGKWGYVSTTPGAELHLRVDTKIHNAGPTGLVLTFDGPLEIPEEKVNIHLFYLKSYDVHMGVAIVHCTNCRCEEHMLQGLDAGNRRSQCVAQRITVTQHTSCIVSVTVGHTNANDFAKVKICGLVTTRDTSQYYQVGAEYAARADQEEEAPQAAAPPL